MAKTEVEPFMIENARIRFPNFRGKAGMYNAEGVRSFGVYIPTDMAGLLAADGWNVKFEDLEEKGDNQGEAYVDVRVRYDKGRPPMVTMITSTNRTPLYEETIGVLDSITASNIDLICTPSAWDVNGKQGIKAYLKTMFVTLEEDALQRKYALQTEPEEEAY